MVEKSVGDPLPVFAPDSERIAAARMAIIDQNRLRAELLDYFCRTYWGFQVVMVAGVFADACETLARAAPDVILISFPLVDCSAIEAMQGIHLAFQTAKLIIQLDRVDEHTLHSLKNIPYHGLLLGSEETPTSLGNIISRVRQGFRAVSTRIVELQSAVRNNPVAYTKLLSEREQQVLACIACSMSDSEIGRHLGLSAETAHSHRKRIMRKLDINSTPHLIRYAITKGFDFVNPPAATRAAPAR